MPKKTDPSILDDFYSEMDGVPTVRAGLSQLPFKLYASDKYQARKKKTIVIGGLHRIVYPAFFIDPNPIILVLRAEPAYHTVLALNLRYVPPKYKEALLSYVVKSNAMRIRSKKPIIVDYQQLKRPFPWISRIVRRYKVALIGVVENVPLIGYPSIAKESSKYSNIYKTDKQ